MRVTPLFLLMLAAVPATAQEPDSLPIFLRPAANKPQDALRAYRENPYEPVRVAEVRAAGFLTEGALFPFGTTLGVVTPPTVTSIQSTAAMMIGSHFAVRPPEGGRYEVGDTLVVAYTQRGPKGWGDVVIPTGIVRVIGVEPRQTITEILTIYGPIRQGQVVYMAEPVNSPGRVMPVATPDGPSGEVIAHRTPRELQMPGGLLFTTLGRDKGIRQGDFVHIRRQPGARTNSADAVDELMATAQVIHVGPRSSTIRVVDVISPEVQPGAPVVRVATLPN